MITLPFFECWPKGRNDLESNPKPFQLKGYYLIGYLDSGVTVKIGDKVIVAGQEVTIISIAHQVYPDHKLEESIAGWKNWMKFDKDLDIDCYVAEDFEKK